MSISLNPSTTFEGFFKKTHMNIYYQGNPGSYMHSASLAIAEHLTPPVTAIEWKTDFKDVWDAIGTEHIAVLAIENSYMWSIHPNLHGFLKHDCKIVWDYEMLINHCLCSKEKDISKVTQAYSQMPALEQCHRYLKDRDIEPRVYSDTALSAKHVAETDSSGKAAICSELAASIHGLNILDRSIQDQSENTTRFAIICHKDLELEYSQKSDKVSMLFEVKHMPASLYQSLKAFADNNVNLTKLESLPSYKWKKTFAFWLDLDGKIEDDHVKKAIQDLEEHTSNMRIIGSY